MPQSFRLPLPSANPEQIHFPDYCICCGAPRQADPTLVVSRLVMWGQRQESVTLRYAVPRCDTCYRRTTAVFLVGLLPFLAGFILLGGTAFVLTAFYASDWELIGTACRAAPLSRCGSRREIGDWRSLIPFPTSPNLQNPI